MASPLERKRSDNKYRVGYAVTFWDDPHGERVGWRFSIAVQLIPALIFAIGLPFLPETYVFRISVVICMLFGILIDYSQSSLAS